MGKYHITNRGGQVVYGNGVEVEVTIHRQVKGKEGKQTSTEHEQKPTGQDSTGTRGERTVHISNDGIGAVGPGAKVTIHGKRVE